MRRSDCRALLGAALLLAACSDEPGASGDSAEATPGATSPAASAGASGGGGSEPLRDSTRVTIEGTVGGRTVDAAGWGECHHTTNASIYDVPAAQWRASYSAESGDLDRLNLTVWEPKAGGAPQVSLHVGAGGRSHAISTVSGGTTTGRGTASAQRNGGAGVLTVEGQDSAGTAIRVTVRCERLTEPVAEGG